MGLIGFGEYGAKLTEAPVLSVCVCTRINLFLSQRGASVQSEEALLPHLACGVPKHQQTDLLGCSTKGNRPVLLTLIDLKTSTSVLKKASMLSSGCSAEVFLMNVFSAD